MADPPLFEWKNNQVLVQPKNSKRNKTLMEKRHILHFYSNSSHVSSRCSKFAVRVVLLCSPVHNWLQHKRTAARGKAALDLR